MYKKLLITFFIIAIQLFAWGESNTQLVPIDETNEDPSFASFKIKLMKAIQSKDSLFIKKILSEDVIYSFGADPERKNATEGFMNYYKINSKKETSFWKDLSRTINLGCTMFEKTFTCPYVYSKWPDKYDSFSYIAVIEKKAVIRSKPIDTAPKIKSVNYEILKLAPEQKKNDWYTIDLGVKKIGYLAKADGRSSTDFRVEFQKISTGWTLKYFIAGD